MTEPKLVPFEGYISDDSDFHGTNKVRQKLRAHGKNINTNQLVREWHEKRNANPTASLITVSQVVSQPLYNRLEGVSTARQLTETVDEFLKRLPPRSTISGSWIWITCPAKGKKVDTHRAPELQDSPDDDMIDRACALLSQFDSEKEQIATSNPNAVQSTITRKLGPLREQLKQDILDLAVRNGVTCGKWMLFPKPEDVNRTWRIVAEAVVQGRLGDTAKVAPSSIDGTTHQKQSSHLICVYTKDFSDLDDVQRVLSELVELGLAPRTASDGAIYYKPDVYTYLNLDSSNSYGLKASLYSSKEIMGLFKIKTPSTTLAGSSKRKQQSLTNMLRDNKKQKS